MTNKPTVPKNAGSQSADPKPPTEPILASTVLLLRDHDGALEVFMVVRHHEIDFASGALVFPGGKVDDADSDERFTDLMAPSWSDVTERVRQVSACREVFEECGVLLARSRSSQEFLDQNSVLALEENRDLIHSGRLAFADFLHQHELVLVTDRLQKFAHWTTPTMMPKRFDTFFYLIRTPKDQVAIHDQHESVDSVWIRPQQVLEDAKQGKRMVIFPTLRNIAKLARFNNVDEALSESAKEPVVQVTPWTEKRDDGKYLMIDPAAGYDVCELKLPDRVRPDRAG